MAPPASVSLTDEERHYYVATAMLTAAFEYSQDDSKSWWLAFLPSLISWLDAVYRAFTHGCRLNISAVKLDAIAAAIVNFLPQAELAVQHRWLGIKEAIDRARTKNIEAGVSSDSARIGIEDLQAIDMGDALLTDPVTGEDGEDDGEHDDGDDDKDDDDKDFEVVSPVRHSSRQPKKAKKVRIASDVTVGEDNEGEGDDGEVSGKGNDDSEGPREKKKAMYLAYDPNIHFYWEKSCCYCSDGNWMCFGDVYLANGRLSSKIKCQSCAILRKPCVEGIRPTAPDVPLASAGSGTIVVRPSSSKPPSVPRPRPNTSKAPLASSSSSVPEFTPVGTVYNVAGAAIGQVSNLPTIDLTNPSLSRKRSALGPPSTAKPSSSKVLRPVASSSGIRRMSSAFSSSPSLPSPLVLSSSLPLEVESSSSRMMVDVPEDQFLLLLDALEFSIDRGNLDDARMRIHALRKLRRQEKGYSGV